MRLLLLMLGGLLVGASTYAQPSVRGLSIGDEVSAWQPVHIAGPHAGTKTCPVCTYLDAPMLLAFAKDVNAAAALAPTLEGIATTHANGKLKVMLVVVGGTEDEVKKLAKDYSISHLMLCRPDPERKEKQLKLYKIDAQVTNTIMLYQDYTVRKAWANIVPADLRTIKASADAYLPKR